MYFEKTIPDFEDLLASKAAVPGGGGASALCASLAVCLGEMVANLTSGNLKYLEYKDQCISIAEKLTSIREKLLFAVDEDAKSFEPLSKAYKISKDDPQRSQIMESCLLTAAQAPLTVMNLLAQAIDLLEELEPIGSKMAIADVACGSMLAYGALYGSYINVKVNTSLMQQQEMKSNINQQAQTLITTYGTKAMNLYQRISERYN